MLTFQRASLVVAFLVAAGAFPLNHAGAAKSVLGSTVCVRADVIGASGSGLVYTSYGVQNASGASLDVVCTLFRDNTTNTTGLQDLELSITDPNSTPGGFVCDALSLDRFGAPQKVKRQPQTAVGNSVLDWGGVLNFSTVKGSYTIHCTVPNGGTLRSIYYLEP